MNPYDVLDVPTDAGPDDIKQAHRRAAKEHHPDAGGEREDFERVQTAYLVLADPARRAKYDRTGSVEDEVENPLAFLAEHIVAAFSAACEQNANWLTQRDLIAATRKVMEGVLADMRTAEQGLRSEAARLEDIVGRVRFRKDGGFDPITNGLRERIGTVMATIEEAERDIPKYTAAIAYLDHYGFEFDQPQPGPTWKTVTLS